MENGAESAAEESKDRSRIWSAIEDRASSQTGLITREQVLEANYPKALWDSKVRSGAVVSLHRGLYELAAPADREARELRSALLLGGEGAVFSHRTAAQLHKLWGIDGFPREITVPRRVRVSAPGLT